MTHDERMKILADARATLERAPEAYTPPPRSAEPQLIRKTTRRRYERPAPQRLDTAPPQQQAAPDWSGWETWLETRLNARLAEEREELLKAIVEITGTALGELLKAEREQSGHELELQLRELKLENAKLQHALQHLGELIQLEKNRTIDLRPLPARIN